MGNLIPTNTILDQIVRQKEKEVEALKNSGRDKNTALSYPPPRDFLGRIRHPQLPGRAIIAEIKRASPSAGVLRQDFDPATIAQAYTENGARCLSVLTDEKFFQGSWQVLREARAATDLPILAKDFIIDRIQITVAREAGADAVLLIARILSAELLEELYSYARSLGLSVLIEVHGKEDLQRALGLKPRPLLIGINNRDLSDFSVSVSRTLSLLPEIPEGITVVSESGLSEPRVLDELAAAGAHAFLIGTSFMKAGDPGAALRRMVFAEVEAPVRNR